MGNIFANLFGPQEESEDVRIKKRISELDPKLSEKEKKKLIKEIEKEEKKKTAQNKKPMFNPVSIFKDRTPKELDERVKAIVKAKLKENPKMTDEQLTKLISDTTVMVVEDLATECQEEYSLMKTILSPKYGNGKWPTRKELEKLIDEKNFPWSKSQIMYWPEEKDITSCQVVNIIKDKIKMSNICVYSLGYDNIVNECNVDCGKGTQIKSKSIVKNVNEDFPSIQPCSGEPQKEFICDSGKICKEDCRLEIDMTTFGKARCSKPCDSGDGPGEKTYKIKYLKSSKGGGSCDLDEKGKKEGEKYDVTVPCNEDKCPDCSIKSKGPYKDQVVDYTRSSIMDGKTKAYTACLLPKEDGTYEDIDCGGNEGGFNYNKGARSKYSITYNITKDDYGVQSCTKGEDVTEEECAVNAFTPDLQPVVKDGKIVKGGGEPCGNECVLSDDYPRLVIVDGKECSKECGTGKKRMRKVVKSKSDAPYCPCKNDPSKCPYEEVDCNTNACIAPCVYANEGKHVQINDYCPGVDGPNKHIVWDTDKEKWYDSVKNKYFSRGDFIKKMRVPTKKPPIGKGLCYQGNKADFIDQCNLDGTEKPIDGKWGPWEFNGYIGEPNTLQSVSPTYKKWDDPSNPNSQAKIDKRVKDRLDANEKDPITGEVLTEDTIRKEETHCVDENYLIIDDIPLPGKKYVRSISIFPEYGGKDVVGPSEKIESYMKKDDGSYSRYCPVDKALIPEVWYGDGQTTGATWEQERCYKIDGTGRSKKYRVSELDEEASKSFTRDVDLPEYATPSRTGEKRIIDAGTRTIYKVKTRGGDETPAEKYGGFPDGKWHKTIGDQSYTYDRRNNEYDECEGVRDILKKIKNNNNDWKAEDRYVLQKDCNPVYDWDGKYYMSDADAQLGKTGEETKTHTDTGRKVLSDEEKKMYPGSSMRKTNNGKFLTNDMFNHAYCQKPGLDSTRGWCGERSTDDFIQMITVSGGLEMIKGVVTQARKDSNQWVKTFEVYVSRNGDSWQQVKDASGNLTFSASFSKKGDKKVENYFQKRVEAKYIRFVTKTWDGHNSMRIGYIKDLSGTIDCKGGDGMQGSTEPWYRLTFNKQKTIQLGGYSEGTHSSTKQCPSDGDVLTYQKGSEPATNFTNLKLNVNNFKEVNSGTPDLSVSKSECKDYAEDIGYNWGGNSKDGNVKGCFVQHSYNIVYYNENNTSTKCQDISVSTCVEKNNITSSSGIQENSLQQAMSTLSASLGTCGNDAERSGWYNSTSATSTGWSDCYKTKSAAQTQGGSDTKAVCGGDGGYQYQFNKWTSVSTSDYKPWKPKDDYEDFAPSDKESHLYNTRRKNCFRNTCHVLPTFTNKMWKSTHCTGETGAGFEAFIINISDKGTDGYVRNTAYTWANKFNNTLWTAAAGKLGVTTGSAENWSINDYEIKEVEGCCNDNNNYNSVNRHWRGRSNTKINGRYGWWNVTAGTNVVDYYKNAISEVTKSAAEDFCEDIGMQLAKRSDINSSFDVCDYGRWSDFQGYYRKSGCDLPRCKWTRYPRHCYCSSTLGNLDGRGGSKRYNSWALSNSTMTHEKCRDRCYAQEECKKTNNAWNDTGGLFHTLKSPYCKYKSKNDSFKNPRFVMKFNLSEERKQGTFIPVGIRVQGSDSDASLADQKNRMPSKIKIEDRIIKLSKPTVKDQIHTYIFKKSDRQAWKNKDLDIHLLSGDTDVTSMRINLLYGIEGKGNSIEKKGICTI